MFEHEKKEKLLYKIVTKSEWVRYYIDLPGVLEPDIDVEIEEMEIIVSALRTLPERKLLTCNLSIPSDYSTDKLVIRFEWGVLEIVVPLKGD